MGCGVPLEVSRDDGKDGLATEGTEEGVCIKAPAAASGCSSLGVGAKRTVFELCVDNGGLCPLCCCSCSRTPTSANVPCSVEGGISIVALEHAVDAESERDVFGPQLLIH